ncbi:MAG: glycoside hydrolase family 78 protein [Paludibacter sp.]
MKLSGTFSILFFLSTSLLLNARSQAIPVNLRCDFWTTPQGIDVPNPELSWTIQTQSDIRAMHQSAYQVLVASSFENLKKDDGDLWNSEKSTIRPHGANYIFRKSIAIEPAMLVES